METSSKFDIEKSIDNNVAILSINGFLDAHTAPDLELAIRESIANGLKVIIIDFAKLDYISSAGFGVFMEFIEELRESNGDIIMVGMSPKIRHLFELLGFDLLFKIYTDKAEYFQKID
jgi:anti-sigma B factor antagonist